MYVYVIRFPVNWADLKLKKKFDQQMKYASIVYKCKSLISFFRRLIHCILSLSVIVNFSGVRSVQILTFCKTAITILILFKFLVNAISNKEKYGFKILKHNAFFNLKLFNYITSQNKSIKIII